jgi:hypothetical protein
MRGHFLAIAGTELSDQAVGSLPRVTLKTTTITKKTATAV